MDKLAEVSREARDPADELEELFAVDLTGRLLEEPVSEDCPRRGDYPDC